MYFLDSVVMLYFRSRDFTWWCSCACMQVCMGLHIVEEIVSMFRPICKWTRTQYNLHVVHSNLPDWTQVICKPRSINCNIWPKKVAMHNFTRYLLVVIRHVRMVLRSRAMLHDLHASYYFCWQYTRLRRRWLFCKLGKDYFTTWIKILQSVFLSMFISVNIFQ